MIDRQELWSGRRGTAEGGDEVWLLLEKTGRDYQLTIAGGVQHQGAVVWAVDGEYRVWERAGHRETELALQAAERLAPLLGGVLLVMAGIHYPAISKEAIERIVESVTLLVEQCAAALSGLN